MLKNSLVIFLPEFKDIEDEILEIYLNSVETSLPENNYLDIEKSKALWVAMSYFDAIQRANALDGSADIKSEKIEDVSTTYRDGSSENPYKKLFYSSIQKEEENPCDITIGFGLSSLWK